MNEKTHDLLMKEFRKYFEAHQEWAMKETHVAGMKTREHLAEIRRLAHKIRAEIQVVRNKKPKIKSPKYKEQLLKDQANQNSQGTGTDIDN